MDCGTAYLTQRDTIAYVLGAFLVLSALNLQDNYSHYRRSPTRIRQVQLLASTLHTTDMALFLVQNTARHIPCLAVVEVASTCYFVFQILAVGTVVQRGTQLLGARWMGPVRWVLGAMFAAALGMNIASDVLKVWFVASDGSCVAIFDRGWNDRAKLIYVFVYLVNLGCFAIPLVKSFTEIFYGAKSQMHTSRRLQRFISGFMGKIALAILVYLVTTILSLYGFWGNYFYVQFAIQDYCNILASSWCAMIVDDEGSRKNKVVLLSKIKMGGSRAGLPSTHTTPHQTGYQSPSLAGTPVKPAQGDRNNDRLSPGAPTQRTQQSSPQSPRATTESRRPSGLGRSVMYGGGPVASNESLRPKPTQVSVSDTQLDKGPRGGSARPSEAQALEQSGRGPTRSRESSGTRQPQRVVSSAQMGEDVEGNEYVEEQRHHHYQQRQQQQQQQQEQQRRGRSRSVSGNMRSRAAEAAAAPASDEAVWDDAHEQGRVHEVTRPVTRSSSRSSSHAGGAVEAGGEQGRLVAPPSSPSLGGHERRRSGPQVPVVVVDAPGVVVGGSRSIAGSSSSSRIGEAGPSTSRRGSSSSSIGGRTRRSSGPTHLAVPGAERGGDGV